ncbi:hypothetical protein [Paenibacillus sp. NEAU-GSW1]|uniref:hypothetical protein n=1 Tax=Paenibacillus sp. NEAU-GSW1 TaxID=2682486 RepID=UPI0012E10158|nr:hypothetical protein [Paenibacillus sp. NEAU-GSW1]MUT66153.1 hypothetical protein [Paenibacillus sp. NEAU-GSW1]
MNSLITIPEIERRIIHIGRFDNINAITKNNTIKDSMNDWHNERSKKPITSMMPLGIGPVLLDSVAGAIKTISKKWAAFDYLEVPHAIASSELEWKGTVKPELDKFYILSPHNNRAYFPFEKYHTLAFEEKVNEAIKILMHLKPRELLVVHEEGYELDVNTNAEVKAKAKLVKGSGEMQMEKKSEKKVMFKASFQKPGLFNNFKTVQLPNDLIWYPSEEKWRSIVDGVLHHGLKEVDMGIHYFEDFGINSKLQADIMKQANIKIGSEVTQFKKTSWKVIASFW